MATLHLDPNTLYQINLTPAWDPDEPSWSVLAWGPDGVSKALAAILEEFLRPLITEGEEHHLEFELGKARKQISVLSTKDVETATTSHILNALNEQIVQIESVVSKAPFLAEVVSSGAATEPAGNFFGDAVEEGVDDLFTDGAPRDLLHLFYGFAEALPDMRFSVTTPTIYR